MTAEPERSTFTPFDRLTDEEMKEAMVMHIRMGFIIRHPDRSSEAEEIALDLVRRLTIDQLKEIHPHTFFSNKKMGVVPKNPYLYAKEILGDE